LLIAKLNGRFKEVPLKEIRRWVMDGHINPMVMNILVEELHQSSGPAPNVQEIQLSSSSDPVHNSCRLFKAEMRLYVVQVLLNPKIPLVVFVAGLLHEAFSFRGRISVASV
jgi:hypothetical protein